MKKKTQYAALASVLAVLVGPALTTEVAVAACSGGYDSFGFPCGGGGGEQRWRGELSGRAWAAACRRAPISRGGRWRLLGCEALSPQEEIVAACPYFLLRPRQRGGAFYLISHHGRRLAPLYHFDFDNPAIETVVRVSLWTSAGYMPDKPDYSLAAYRHLARRPRPPPMRTVPVTPSHRNARARGSTLLRQITVRAL